MRTLGSLFAFSLVTLPSLAASHATHFLPAHEPGVLALLGGGLIILAVLVRRHIHE